MQHVELMKLKEQLAAWAVVARSDMHLIRLRNGELRPVSVDAATTRQQTFERVELQSFDIWDGERALCSAGSHATGQRGVRVNALMAWIDSLPLDGFNPKNDALAIIIDGDMKTLKHYRYGARIKKY